jgi:hypothetical protein
MFKINFRKFNLRKIATKVVTIVGMVTLGTALAHAGTTQGIENLHVIQTTIGGTTRTAMRMIMLVAAIAGISFVAMALFSFKAASDSAGQQNNNLQKGVVKLVIGGALISLPFLLRVSQNSVMKSGMSGSGLVVPIESSIYSGKADDK